MCFRLLKKTIAICLIGLGVGILAVLLLPLSWWLFIFGLGIIICGFACISCWELGEWGMNIVVKKVPKCLRGIVKLIFGIKD